MTNPSWMLLATCVFISSTSFAQSYPSRPVRIIVPFPPGGGSDDLVRLITPRLTEALEQQVIVDNRPGGGSVIGTQLIAKGAPDGYTYGIVDLSFVTNPGLRSKLPYDSARDFAPVVALASSAALLVVHPSLPVRSVKELVALAKARPGELNYASGGNGAGSHLAGELLKIVAGIKLVHVPYKGVGPAIVDTLAGQVTITFAGVNSGRTLVEQGRLRALAVADKTRKPALPNVPTFTEAGYKGLEMPTVRGLLAPAQTPTELIGVMNARLNKTLSIPDVRQRLLDLGYETVGGTPEDWGKHLAMEIARWTKVIRSANIKLD